MMAVLFKYKGTTTQFHQHKLETSHVHTSSPLQLKNFSISQKRVCTLALMFAHVCVSKHHALHY